MPCKDTTALMTVRVDHSDFLIGYDYAKISCDKAIGNGQSFHQYCQGKPIQQILEWEFFQILQDLKLEEEESENQFLVYLEWSALRSALIQYLGREDDVDTEQFEVASISNLASSVPAKFQVNLQAIGTPPSGNSINSDTQNNSQTG
jgi:hypothetical protein